MEQFKRPQHIITSSPLLNYLVQKGLWKGGGISPDELEKIAKANNIDPKDFDKVGGHKVVKPDTSERKIVIKSINKNS